jgi:hypothetical protein
MVMFIKTPVILFAFLLINCQIILGNNGDDNPFREVFFSLGTNGQKTPAGSLDNFRKLAPGSPLLKQNPNLNLANNYRSYDGTLLLLGVGFQSKKRNNGPTYRFALGYGVSFMENFGGDKSRSFRVDTLTSSRTGAQTYIDSNVYEYFNMVNSTACVSADISVVWRSSKRHKLKLFCGIGGNYVFSTYSATQISHVNYSSIRYNQRPMNTINNSVIENYTQKRQVFISAYCPFGMDYSLSKTKKFWKTIHLFIEARAQIYYGNIPELSESIQGRMQIGFGIRKSFSRDS